jgi:hypothetical protein
MIHPFINTVVPSSKLLETIKFQKTILLLIGTKPLPIEFSQLLIDDDLFEKYKKHLILYEIYSKFINDKNIHSIIELSREVIDKYNTLNYDLKDNNYVYPIFSIEFKKILLYLQKQFVEKDSLVEYYHHLQLSEVFNHKIDYHKLINIIDDTKWWEYLYKNITNNFINRKYKFQFSRIADIETRNKYKRLFKINDKTTENYNISELNRFFDDISVIFNGSYKYHTNNITDISIVNINNLIDSFDRPNFSIYYPIKIICFLLVNKKYSNMIVNNDFILHLITTSFKSYLPILRYYLGFTWIKLYFDESVIGINSKSTDTHIFTINTASRLPYFPVDYKNLTFNPYIAFPVKQQCISQDNLYGLPTYTNNNYNIRKINNLDTFKKNIKKFISGIYSDFLKDINLKEHNMAISGSIMAACISDSPLLKFYHDEYYDHFYEDADIDVMVKGDVFEFINNVASFHMKLKTNINKINSKIDVFLEDKTFASLFIPKKYMKDTFGIEKYDVTNSQIKEILKPLFEQLRDEYLTTLDIDKLNAEGKTINFNCDYNIFITKNKEPSLTYSFKYKILSPLLKHQFELFQVKSYDFIGIVSRFHLGCVRAYYDGEDVYMTPSCITAHLTGMHLDIKYVSSVRNPIEIDMKYRNRGFSRILSIRESCVLHNYCNSIEPWKTLCNKQKILGNIDYTHPIFHRNLKTYNNNLLINQLSVFDYIDQINNIYNLKKNLILSQFINYNAIDNDGFITSPLMWLIDFYHNTIITDKFNVIVGNSPFC